jgi:hypothetical protein
VNIHLDEVALRGERASIWFPGQTLFIVVTLPGVEVKWLPEHARRGVDTEPLAFQIG